MKIACFLIDDNQKKIIKSKFEDVVLFSGPLSRENITRVLDVEVLVSRPRGIDLRFDSKVLSKFKNLKFICSMSTGFDHIDLDYCKKNNIIVSNVPSYSETSVSEHAFALILAISRKIPQSLNNTKNKNLTGFDLKGKKLGVIGSGKIGLEVIRIANGFGMEVIAHDVILNKKAQKELGFDYVELDDLLRKSDIISVHVPYNKHTFHLLNKDNLSLVKKGVVLINTSRGELIESSALLGGLKSGRIDFAGLDVLEKGFRFNRKILEMQNVFVTPHNAANSLESKENMLNETIENIESFMKGEERNLL